MMVQRELNSGPPRYDKDKRVENTQSLLPTSFGKESTATIKRGLLWQQRKKLFSMWKERYFILTKDYLYCFQGLGANNFSKMGRLLFKVRLVDVERVVWEYRSTYSVVVLALENNDKIYLRASDGLEDWFKLIDECTHLSKKKRKALKHSCVGNTGNKGKDSVGESLAKVSKDSIVKYKPRSSTDTKNCIQGMEFVIVRGRTATFGGTVQCYNHQVAQRATPASSSAKRTRIG